MFKFNYESFKEALKNKEQETDSVLIDDIEKVKAWVEKALSLSLESNSNIARTNYPGIEP